MMPRPLAPLLALALSCAPRLLPGTDIRDTPDTRAIASAIEAYRRAMVSRDPQAVMKLVAPDYFDSSTADAPGGAVDRAGLRTRLEDLTKLTAFRLELSLRGLEMSKGTAQAEVYFDQYYRVATPNGEVARHDADAHRMTLQKLNGTWMFTSGL